jgi:hypothetical protein
LPFEEKVLECKIAFLSERQPFFLLEVLELSLEVIEKSPGTLCFMQLVLHWLIILELRLSFSKMLGIYE